MKLDDKKFLSVVGNDATGALDQVKGIDFDRVFFSDLLVETKTSRKEVNERRLQITRPMDKAKASVMNLFKPVDQALGELEVFLRTAIEKDYDEENTRRQEALKAAKEAGNMEALEAAVTPVAKVPGTRKRKELVWGVTDFKKIPKAYKKVILNDKLVETTLKAGENIPGIESHYQTKISAGRTL